MPPVSPSLAGRAVFLTHDPINKIKNDEPDTIEKKHKEVVLWINLVRGFADESDDAVRYT